MVLVDLGPQDLLEDRLVLEVQKIPCFQMGPAVLDLQGRRGSRGVQLRLQLLLVLLVLSLLPVPVPLELLWAPVDQMAQEVQVVLGIQVVPRSQVLQCCPGNLGYQGTQFLLAPREDLAAHVVRTAQWILKDIVFKSL